MLYDLGIVGMIGGITAMDTTAGPQWMISQPIVIGVILGALLGDVGLGVLFGMLLELIWIGAIPVGGSKLLDINEAGVVAVATGIYLVHRCGMARPDAVLWTLLYVPLVGLAGFKLTVLIRKWNGYLVCQAEEMARGGRISWISFYHLSGAALSFGRGILLSMGGVILGIVLIPRVSALFPALDESILARVISALFGLGVAALFTFFRLRPLIPYLAVGVGAGMLLRLL
jgi:mannose/fructose/N-acetylgalactosamine-specific phosphotransferase system component IIC